jgi:RimJ/RimL family protein N-acetyltransferase
MASEISTARLRLVPVGRSDEDALGALFSHDDVARYLSEEVPSRAAIGDMIGLSLDASSIASFWRVSVDGSGVLGLVGLWPPSTSALALRAIGWRSLELVIAFHPSAWGRGYAREALEAAVAHGLSDGVTFAILGAVAEPNEAAHALMRRSRFDVLGRVAGAKHPITVYERAS